VAEEFEFVTMDGTLPIEEQQARVREMVTDRFDLPRYRWKTQI
jgi:hypothetical protein